MKHIWTMTAQSRPAMAASSLIVKQTYIELWTDAISFASDLLAFVRDLTGTGGE